MLISHGLNDFNVKPRHAARLWAALQAHNIPAKIWWNQGGHGDRANSARQAAWRDTLNRFWSQHLFGVNNGVMDGPKAVVERENNEWVDYADWPVPGARATTFRLVAGGDAERHRPARRCTRAAASADRAHRRRLVDRRERARRGRRSHRNRLVYQSAPLAAPVHISGIPSVSLRLSFDKPAAIVSAMLVDYKADRRAGHRHARLGRSAEPRVDLEDDAGRARHAVHDRLRAAAARLRVSGRVAHRPRAALERSAVHAAAAAGHAVTVRRREHARLPVVGDEPRGGRRMLDRCGRRHLQHEHAATSRSAR